MQDQGELIDWQTVRVENGSGADALVIVEGETPDDGMSVALVPDPTGVIEWEYQPVEVRATSIGHERSHVVTPFEVSGRLGTLSRGSNKIVLVGMTKREYIPPEPS